MIIAEVSGLADESRRSPRWRSRTRAGRGPRGARRPERTPSHPRGPRNAGRPRGEIRSDCPDSACRPRQGGADRHRPPRPTPGADLHVGARVPIDLPGVVHEGLVHGASHVGTSIHPRPTGRKRVLHPAAHHVPVDGNTVERIGEVTGLVVEHAGQLHPTRAVTPTPMM